MFFNIGGAEILVIAMVALIAVGPEQLPGVLRKVGRFVAQARAMTAGLRDEFMSGIDEVKDLADPDQWMGTGSDDDPVVPRGYAKRQRAQDLAADTSDPFAKALDESSAETDADADADTGADTDTELDADPDTDTDPDADTGTGGLGAAEANTAEPRITNGTAEAVAADTDTTLGTADAAAANGSEAAETGAGEGESRR